ncbi:MAG: hypothetical protein AAB472_01305 [Patescibacteria group bacterium]
MSTVDINQLISLVQNVRDGILADYATNQGKRMNIRRASAIEWVQPLMSVQPNAPAKDYPQGALHYRTYEMDSHGCQTATLRLLSRMPKSPDELSPFVVSSVEVLLTLTAGKYLSSCIGWSTRHALIGVEVGGRLGVLNLVHDLAFMPLMNDMLCRFTKEVETLPARFDPMENISRLTAVSA